MRAAVTCTCSGAGVSAMSQEAQPPVPANSNLHPAIARCPLPAHTQLTLPPSSLWPRLRCGASLPAPTKPSRRVAAKLWEAEATVEADSQRRPPPWKAAACVAEAPSAETMCRVPSLTLACSPGGGGPGCTALRLNPSLARCRAASCTSTIAVNAGSEAAMRAITSAAAASAAGAEVLDAAEPSSAFGMCRGLQGSQRSSAGSRRPANLVLRMRLLPQKRCLCHLAGGRALEVDRDAGPPTFIVECSTFCSR